MNVIGITFRDRLRFIYLWKALTRNFYSFLYIFALLEKNKFREKTNWLSRAHLSVV